MSHATYCLRPNFQLAEDYLVDVSMLADEVVVVGRELHPLLDAYGDFVEASGREARRRREEYLVEALMLGVLWRARGQEATEAAALQGDLVSALVDERQQGRSRRLDGSNAKILVLGIPTRPGRLDASVRDLQTLADWLLATGEYDDEVERLAGWLAFLHSTLDARTHLRQLMLFAVAFECMSEKRLARYTRRVDHFLGWKLPMRPVREDTVQCSRRRIEYHFNMVGAELLNRAWRGDFVACARQVVVLPGCARRHGHDCRAMASETELRCTHCSASCSVSRATQIASRHGAEAIAVLHNSDFGRFLSSPTLEGGEVGIVGVACVPGLVGAGWRARAKGFAAQCVLLIASGCAHWLDEPRPTTLAFAELERICTVPGRLARPALCS
jgi:hypothetical protein